MSVSCLGAKGLEPRGGRWGRGQHVSSGPVGSWAHMLCRFHLKGHFVGRECWQEARAAFGSERAEPFEFSVKSKEWSVSPLPAWEPRPLAGTSLARQAATSGCRQGWGWGGGEGGWWKPLQAHVLGKITWENFPGVGWILRKQSWQESISSGGT